MAHPAAQLQNVADFSKAVLQAPAFLRASGAADMMEDLIISLKGRPVTRKGYEVIATSTLSIGTEDDEYTEGDQVVVVHWLGDEDTPDGIKRLYYLPINASWVQDERGRLLFIASREDTPKFIDIKDNVVYDWVMDAPNFVPDGSSFGMTPTGQGPLNVKRDLGLISAGGIEKGGINAIFPNPSSKGVYIDIRALTDITSATLEIRDAGGDAVRLLFSGSLAQGGHRFFWDARNDSENVVALGNYIASFIINEIPGVEIDNFDDLETFSVTDTPTQASEFYLSGQFRFICYTYVNEDLNIESLPSVIDKERVYFWYYDDVDPPEFEVDVTLTGSDAPNWATHINVYVSEEPTPPEHETEPIAKAIETGFDFFRIGTIEIGEKTLSDYEGLIGSDALRLDSFEHDGPVEGFHTMGAYGVGLWGAEGNRVYFSKIGNQGEQRIYALPSENALVPHSFPLSKSGQSPIVHVHPAAHDSALLCFKRDALHVIKGKGIITGLYNPDTPVQVDIDASSVIEGLGTMSPRSVLTIGTSVYFVGSDNRFYQYGADWRGNTEVKDVGLPIQQYLEEFDVEELEKLVAFLHNNCYHLITPERVIIMDMTRKYWTTASWELKDAFWSRGGINAESILYGLTQEDILIQLFKGDTDGGDAIGGVWQSNPVMIPSESPVTGVLAVHTTDPPPTMRCRVDIDDVEGEVDEVEFAKWNDFRCGVHGSGSRASVRLESDDGFPLLDRIQLEWFPVP